MNTRKSVYKLVDINMNEYIGTKDELMEQMNVSLNQLNNILYYKFNSYDKYVRVDEYDIYNSDGTFRVHCYEKTQRGVYLQVKGRTYKTISRWERM